MNLPNIKLSLQQKVQLFVLLSAGLVILFTMGYFTQSTSKKINDKTRELVDAYAQKFALISANQLDEYLNASRSLKETFENYRLIPEEARNNRLKGVLKKTLTTNPDYLSAWGIVKSNSKKSFTSGDKDSSRLGDFDYVFYKRSGTIQSAPNDKVPEKLIGEDIYSRIKRRQRETVTAPEYYSYTGFDRDKMLKSNFINPLKDNKDFMGIVGIDAPLDKLQEKVSTFHPMKNDFAFLFTDKGKIIAYPNEEAIGSFVDELDFFPEGNIAWKQKLSSGRSFRFNSTFNRDEKYFVSVVPVKIGNTNTPWYIGYALPQNVISEDVDNSLLFGWIIGLIGLLIIGTVVWYTSRNISRPLGKLHYAIDNIAMGNVGQSTKTNIRTGDEIEGIAQSLNQHIDGYTNKIDFASRIGQGDLNADIELLSDKDHLGKSLIQIRDSLKQAREEEKKREEEERKRRWANEGIAKFADLLRRDNDNLENLSYSIISNLVQYLEANQGGIFLLNDNDEENPFYELKAAYAFDRRKYLDKQIKPGEGLVGTCVLEKQTIYLKEIPQDYINITSGLGDANPGSLMIIPLKVEEDVLGVLEIASFQEFEQYKVDFVEKVAESIASTVSSTKTNMKTNQLLQKSQQQAEEMKSQEEEMRQNMEEMQATQEELSRKNQENENMKNELSREKALLDALMNNLPDFIFFKDKDSKFIRISKSMLPLFPVDTLEEMIGKSDFDFHQPDAAKEMYNEEQEIIRTEKGFKDKTQHEITETGKEQWVSVTKLPLYDENGKLIGTFGISKDITQFKKLEIESREKNEKLEKKVEELNAYQQEASIKESENRGLAEVVNSIMWKAELDNEGNMLSANNLFLDNTGYNSDELVGKNIGEILADRDREDLRDILEKIKQNTTQKIELNVNAKSGEVLNLFVSLIPVMADKNNALQKIILLGNNNSHSALG